MLRFMLERLESLKVDRLVVATSDYPEDDRVEAVAQAAGVVCVRGPEQDVLARFALALRSNPADTVVRLTADCPLIDPEVVNQLIVLFRRTGVDYASNTLVRTYPVGLDAEVLTAVALETADREATDPVEREHVTPFIYRRPARFRLAALRQDRLLGHERWTVDTAADLDRVRRMVDTAGAKDGSELAGNPRRLRPFTISRVAVADTPGPRHRGGCGSRGSGSAASRRTQRASRARCVRFWSARWTTRPSVPGSF